MKYTITVIRTTGKQVTEFTYDQLDDARTHFQNIGNHIPYQRVLVLLVEKPDAARENILDVDFIDGLAI